MGDLDVVQMFEPYVSLASQMGVGDILYAASARGPTVYTTFLASRDSIRRNRAAFSAMIRATRPDVGVASRTQREGTGGCGRAILPDVPRDILASSLQRYRDAGLWARAPEVSRQGFARLAVSLKSGGFISHMHTYEDCVEQSLS